MEETKKLGSQVATKKEAKNQGSQEAGKPRKKARKARASQEAIKPRTQPAKKRMSQKVRKYKKAQYLLVLRS